MATTARVIPFKRNPRPIQGTDLTDLRHWAMQAVAADSVPTSLVDEMRSILDEAQPAPAFERLAWLERRVEELERKLSA